MAQTNRLSTWAKQLANKVGLMDVTEAGEPIPFLAQVGVHSATPVLFTDNVVIVKDFYSDSWPRTELSKWPEKSYRLFQYEIRLSGFDTTNVLYSMNLLMMAFEQVGVSKDNAWVSDMTYDHVRNTIAFNDNLSASGDEPCGFMRWYRHEQYGALVRCYTKRKENKLVVSIRVSLDEKHTDMLYDMFYKRLVQLGG